MVALVANVADVHAAAIRRGLGERDKLGRFGKSRRRVDQRRSHPERTFVHCRSDEVLHLAQLFWRRIDVVAADDVHSRGRRADEAGDIRRHALRFEHVQEVGQRVPCHVIANVALTIGHIRLRRLIDRAEAPALAEDLRRHALADIAFTRAILDQRFGGPAQHIDEARGHRHAAGVDRCRRRSREVGSDRRDIFARDGDIADIGRAAAAIDNGAAADQQIVARRIPRARRPGRRRVLLHRPARA